MISHTLQVTGMHCKACVILTESEAQDLPHIISAKSDLVAQTITITGEFGERTRHDLACELTAVLSKHGYSVSVEKPAAIRTWGDFKLAVPTAFAFLALFVVLQRLGLVNLVPDGTVSYGTAFVVGIVASLSTCMAVVGGLVLSLSATFAKGGERWKPQVLFHAGRLASFFVLGGVIGMLGAVFTLNAGTAFVLDVVIALVMLVLGINLLDIFHWSKRLAPSMPPWLAKRALGVSKLNHSLTPLVAGIATFFLPCGFTQAMQVYTLGTGSFLAGAFTMGAFALGTLPVLAVVSFSSFSIRDSVYAGVFFKAAGIIVILFAIFNLLNGLVSIGVIQPFLNF